MAALHDRKEVTTADVEESAELALLHRVRRKPFEELELDMGVVSSILAGESIPGPKPGANQRTVGARSW